MQGTQTEVLEGALESLQQGHQVTLVSVVKTWGTSPRPVGALLAVSTCGRFYGSVSGGCVEDDLIEKLVKNPPQNPEITVYGETQEERNRFGLPCGGTLQLLLEPLTDQGDLHPLIAAIEERQTLVRRTFLDTGNIDIQAARQSDSAELTEHYWQNIFGPQWRLIVIGAGQTSHYLAEMAGALGYNTVIIDPRPDYRANWSVAATTLLDGYPDDVIQQLGLDERTAVVALTHDPKLDDLALIESINSPAFYVGALGSVRTSANRRQRLIEHFDFTNEQVDKLHGPVGLSIGSKTPPEIALSVLAQITAIRNGVH